MELDGEADLAGLPDFVRAAATCRRRASAACRASTSSPCSVPASSRSCSSRRAATCARRRSAPGIARGDNGGKTDNKAIIAETIALRGERARLLGYPTFAHYRLDDAMAKTPEAVRSLLDTVWQPARERALADRDAMQELIAEEGGNFKLAAWDWRYYAEKLRKRRCDFEESEVKPYFPLDRVVEAAFHGAQRLFGLTFHPVDVPVWHPDVRAWEVRGADGSHVGIFFGDYFARPSKHGGAWMGTLRDQEKLAGDVRPLVLNVMNFNKGEPTLLSFEDARTLFHEMGHALHGLLSDVTYPTVSCTSVLTDWVELPSQLYEHWFEQPDMLRKFARHCQTGEPIPEALVGKLMAAQATSTRLPDAGIHFVGDGRSRPCTCCRRPMGSMSTRSKRTRSSASACRRRSRCATGRRTSPTYSRAATTPPPITATCGRRCSTPTRSRRSRRPATSSIRRSRAAARPRAVDRRLARSGRALCCVPRPAAERRRAAQEARLRLRGRRPGP